MNFCINYWIELLIFHCLATTQEFCITELKIVNVVTVSMHACQRFVFMIFLNFLIYLDANYWHFRINYWHTLFYLPWCIFLTGVKNYCAPGRGLSLFRIKFQQDVILKKIQKGKFFLWKCHHQGHSVKCGAMVGGNGGGSRAAAAWRALIGLGKGQHNEQWRTVLQHSKSIVLDSVMNWQKSRIVLATNLTTKR